MLLRQLLERSYDSLKALPALMRFDLLVVICVEQSQHDDDGAGCVRQESGKFYSDGSFCLKCREGSCHVGPL